MKKIILFLSVFTLINCQTQSQKNAQCSPDSSEKQLAFYGPVNFTEYNYNETNPYAVDFRIDKTNTNYDFSFLIRLKKGAHFVSPNAKRDFSGKLKIVLEKNANKIEFVNSLIENPLTKEEIDSHPFVNGTVNWVREDTNYTQQIKPLTNEDFQVDGYLHFTIEPRCTLEKVPFSIIQENQKIRLDIPGC